MTDKVTFNPGRQGPFYQTLDPLVDAYFKEHNLSTKGNKEMYTKTIILLTSFCLVYVLLLLLPNSPIAPYLAIFRGFIVAGIGFCIQHDANHGGYSEKAVVNNRMKLTLNLVGGIDFIWEQQHNIDHHTYTNIDQKDGDIEFGVLARMSPHKKWYPWHVFQFIYMPILYCIYYFAWVFVLDFIKYGTMVSRSKKGLGATKHINFWVSKIVYVVVWVLIPYWITGMAGLEHFLITGVVISITISLVFQPAHVILTTRFLAPDKTGTMPYEFGIHQVLTTSNFSPNSKFADWYTGGLNRQIEHHLFPKICHVHYRALSPLVKRVCMQFGIPYNVQKTFLHAVWSHETHLFLLGNPWFIKAK